MCFWQGLVEALLSRDPAQRPSARAVLLHPWLKEGGAPTTSIEPEVLVRLKSYADNHKLKKVALKVRGPWGLEGWGAGGREEGGEAQRADEGGAPCNLYTREPSPQSHAGEQYAVSVRRSLPLSLRVGLKMRGNWEIRDMGAMRARGKGDCLRGEEEEALWRGAEEGIGQRGGRRRGRGWCEKKEARRLVRGRGRKGRVGAIGRTKGEHARALLPLELPTRYRLMNLLICHVSRP